MLSKASQKKFLDLCEEGDLETIKTMIAEDPSLINCKDPDDGKCNRSMTFIKSQYSPCK